MRVLIVLPSLGGGGTERVASALGNYLCERHRVEIVLLQKGKVESYETCDGIDIKEIGIFYDPGSHFTAVRSYIVNYRRLVSSLLKELDRFRPDALISFLPKSDFLAYFLTKKRKIVWIASERNDPTERNILEKIVLDHIYKHCSVLVCQTRKVAVYYKKRGVKHIEVIENPVTRDLIPSGRDIGFKDYAVAIGRLDKQKNYEMMICAFCAASTEGIATKHLLILGEGPDRKSLQNLIERNRCEGCVHLLGRRENIADYLCNAKFFVMSSDYEGMPNALFEAMVMGVPVICTDFWTGAAKEWVPHQGGILVPVHDVEKLKDAIVELSSLTRSELTEMGEANRRKVESMCLENMYKKWEKTICRISKL